MRDKIENIIIKTAMWALPALILTIMGVAILAPNHNNVEEHCTQTTSSGESYYDCIKSAR